MPPGPLGSVPTTQSLRIVDQLLRNRYEYTYRSPCADLVLSAILGIGWRCDAKDWIAAPESSGHLPRPRWVRRATTAAAWRDSGRWFGLREHLSALCLATWTQASSRRRDATAAATARSPSAASAAAITGGVTSRCCASNPRNSGGGGRNACRSPLRSS